MLVLSRKKGESIIVGKDIKFTILNQQGDNVRVGIEADPNISIWREELYQDAKEKEKIKEQKKSKK